MHVAKDGEWLQPNSTRLRLGVFCDCGLRHRVNFRIRGRGHSVSGVPNED